LSGLVAFCITANGAGVCEGVVFCFPAVSFIVLQLIKILWMKDSSEAAILQIQC